jgi:hypothetical protein
MTVKSCPTNKVGVLFYKNILKIFFFLQQIFIPKNILLWTLDSILKNKLQELEKEGFLFELCWLPQRPSLTLHPLGGSTPCLWPLFLLREKGKRKEMTGTQHVGALNINFFNNKTRTE